MTVQSIKSMKIPMVWARWLCSDFMHIYFCSYNYMDAMRVLLLLSYNWMCLQHILRQFNYIQTIMDKVNLAGKRNGKSVFFSIHQ